MLNPSAEIAMDVVRLTAGDHLAKALDFIAAALEFSDVGFLLRGLKSSASGKQAGLPVIIFGGDNADIPLTVHAGAYVAELVASGNRPCIIDLCGWPWATGPGSSSISPRLCSATPAARAGSASMRSTTSRLSPAF
jgi:hypothetical protein